MSMSSSSSSGLSTQGWSSVNTTGGTYTVTNANTAVVPIITNSLAGGGPYTSWSLANNMITIGQATMSLPKAIELYNGAIFTKEEIREAIEQGIQNSSLSIVEHLVDLVYSKIWTQDEARKYLGLDILE